MVLIVTLDGRFKPYYYPDSSPSIKRSDRIGTVTPIFSDLLENYLDKEFSSHNLKPHKDERVKIYEKLEKHVRARVYARDIMYKFPKTLPPNASITEAANLMQQNQFHHIPIVENEILTGILSDRNIWEAIANDQKLSDQVYSIMSKKVISGQEHTPISEIARVMLYENIHCLPIIDSHLRLKGIVTTSDILNFLVTSFPLDLYG